MFRLIILSLCVLLAACKNDASSALGTLERDRILLKATASEIIMQQPIQEGSMVKEGQLLLQLDDRRQKAIVAKAQADLQQADAKWDELRNGARVEDINAARADVSNAQAALTVAEKTYKRAHELRAKKLNTQAELDQAIAQRDSSASLLKSAEQHLLVLTNGTRKEELDQAEAAVSAAKAMLELEQIKLDELSIVASRDGRLDSLPWHRGERVLSGSTVAVILADDSPYGRVYVPEPWRSQLKVGDIRNMHVDGIEQPIQVRLRWVSSEPSFTPYYALNESDRARLVYIAKFDLLEYKDLASGLPVEIDMPAP
ncbi:HlyD family secretion protein [Agaribacterium sp. ZY112]|uniref:HlyD family secretion protein n=1 Tax=Agaribacterium sp. ZY112 TaxID=3233574 RepID=UPI0035262C8D